MKTNVPAYGNIFFAGETYADLASINPLHIRDGYGALVKGRNASDDNLGGIFFWHADSTAAIGELVIQPDKGGDGRWIKSKGAQGAGLEVIQSPGGSAEVGYRSAIGTMTRTVREKLDERYSVKDFGAKLDGVTDDTAAFSAAFLAVVAAGGGNLYIPNGTMCITGFSHNFTHGRGVTLVGAGKRVTKIKKIGNTTTPIIAYQAPVNVLEIYSDIVDIAFEGNGLCDGLSLTRCARLSLRNLDIRGCTTAIHSIGSLVLNLYDMTVQGNVTGLKTELSNSTPAIYANAINIFGGQWGLNSAYAFDVGHASGFHLFGVDCEANGVTGNLQTGGIVFRNNVAAEAGTSFASINSTWFEGNRGVGVRVEAGLEASFGLSLDAVQILDTHGGHSLIVEGGFFSAVNCRSPSTNDTWQIAAVSEVLTNCNITTINSTTRAPARVWINVSTGNLGVGSNGGISGLAIAAGAPLLFRGNNGAVEHSAGVDPETGGLMLYPQAGFPIRAGDGAWNGRPLMLGNYYLWVDADGFLRMKLGRPTSVNDGQKVASQT